MNWRVRQHLWRGCIAASLLLSACSASRFPFTDWPIDNVTTEHELMNSGGEFQQYPYSTQTPYFHGGIDIVAEPLGPWVRSVREGTVFITDYGPYSLYNGVSVKAPDGSIYDYWHLDSASIQQPVRDAFVYFTLLPAGTQLAQLVVWGACAGSDHLHFNMTDSGGQQWDPIGWLQPKGDTSNPAIFSVEFTENTRNNVFPINTNGAPILRDDVDIIVQAYDTQFGMKTTGIMELSYYVFDPAIGRSVNDGTAIRFAEIPDDAYIEDMYRNASPFDSISNYCGAEYYYYVITNVDSDGNILADADGFWDTTTLANGDYDVYVTAEDSSGNQDVKITRVEILN